MNAGVGALTFLIQSASDVNARLLNVVSDTEANFEVTVELSDGSSTTYKLTLVDVNNTILARETSPDKLPASCPERHINFDGTFCIYWKQAQDLTVKDVSSAISWWQHLLAYLTLQVRAAKRKSWPGKEWAHGSAAKYQQAAENAAQALGASFVNWLNQGKLTVNKIKWKDYRGPLFRLNLESQHLCSVWGALDTVANKRQPCICNLPVGQRRKRIKSCKDHAIQIKELTMGVYNQNLQTEKFWESYKEKQCCGTMDNCPLKK